MRFVAGLFSILAFASTLCAAAPAPVVILSIEGAIGPASAHFVKRAIERGAKEGAELVIVQVDTPGGLDTSMRAVIKAILSARIPPTPLKKGAPGEGRLPRKANGSRSEMFPSTVR